MGIEPIHVKFKLREEPSLFVAIDRLYLPSDPSEEIMGNDPISLTAYFPNCET